MYALQIYPVTADQRYPFRKKISDASRIWAGQLRFLERCIWARWIREKGRLPSCRTFQSPGSVGRKSFCIKRTQEICYLCYVLERSGFCMKKFFTRVFSTTNLQCRKITSHVSRVTVFMQNIQICLSFLSSSRESIRSDVEWMASGIYRSKWI